MHRLTKTINRLLKPSNTSSSNNNSNSKIGILGSADIGGSEQFKLQSLNRDHKSLTDWERKIDALAYILFQKRIWSAHELRKGIELLPSNSYLNITYYEKWMYSILINTLNKGLYTELELKNEYNQLCDQYSDTSTTMAPRFKVGDIICVRDVFDSEITSSLWRLALKLPTKQHIRTPGYIQNKIGKIQSYVGIYKNAELASFDIKHRKSHLYRVRFKQKDVWNDYNDDNNDNDTIDIELLEHWLQKTNVFDHDHNHHNHSHTFIQKNRESVKRNAIDIEPVLSSYEILSSCVIKLLIKKGIITMNEIRKQMEVIDNKLYENLGSRIVIKAWREPKWKEQILNGNINPYKLIRKAFKEIPNDYYETNLKFVENTDLIHNVVVCTLCSCYPRQLLGIPPAWYKSLKYRSEIIKKPRELLKNEFGCIIPKNIIIRVHDSAYDLRYIVLPHLPSQIPGWENMTDNQLQQLIRRDMMIGVCR